MSKARIAKLAAAVVLPVLVAACGAPPMQRGYIVDDLALSQVRIGSSAEHVILALGTPSVVSTVGGKGYYYISQTMSQTYQFMQPTVADQRVLAIHLDAKNKVERIGNYGMQDGRLFDFITRTTPSGGEQLTFVRQLLKASSFMTPAAGGGGGRQPGQ